MSSITYAEIIEETVQQSIFQHCNDFAFLSVLIYDMGRLLLDGLC